MFKTDSQDEESLQSCKPSFQICSSGQLIKASLQGNWDMQTDLAYLTELSEAFSAHSKKPWALFVDMRGLTIHHSLKSFNNQHPIFLDRRNQKYECWLLSEPGQADHLIFYVEGAKVKLTQCLTLESAKQALNENGFPLF